MLSGDRDTDPGWELADEHGDAVIFSASSVSAVQVDETAGRVRVTCGASVFAFTPEAAAPVVAYFRGRLKGQGKVVVHL